MKPKLMLILDRMNKIYTENGNRINESTDWIHYSYHPKNVWKGSQNITDYRHYHWTHIRNLSLGDVTLINEDPYKKRAYAIYSKKKILQGLKKNTDF